jgi:uncharacterized membrane protein YfcA
MNPLSVIFGALVGFSLRLTGGGGALFAVPLLVYGLGVPPREAVGVSLATVGATAAVGFVQRLRAGLVEMPTGLLFAAAGMIGAPAGSWLAGMIPSAILLSLFGLLMLVIAARMWHKASDGAERLAIVPGGDHGPACRRDPTGKLRLTSRCAMVLVNVGLITGVLSGLFGVGGGFIIVPALVTFSGMGMQRAIGTSLLVMALVSVSGTGGYLMAGQTLPMEIVGPFIGGGMVGLFGGSWLGRRVAGPVLQRLFATMIVLVAAVVLVKNLTGY